MKGIGFLERITIAEFFATHFATARKGPLNAEAADEMRVGERMAAVLGDGIAAWVSLPNPATRATVKDRRAFTAFVKKHLPGEVETVEQVRDGTQRELLRQAKANGGKWISPDGEPIEIPGVEVSAGEPSPRVELTADAAEVIGEAWRAGLIDLGAMLALPAAGGEPGE